MQTCEIVFDIGRRSPIGGVELDELAAMPQEQQERAVKMIEEGDPAGADVVNQPRAMDNA
jgi:hypothetical protein